MSEMRKWIESLEDNYQRVAELLIKERADNAILVEEVKMLRNAINQRVALENRGIIDMFKGNS